MKIKRGNNGCGDEQTQAKSFTCAENLCKSPESVPMTVKTVGVTGDFQMSLGGFAQNLEKIFFDNIEDIACYSKKDIHDLQSTCTVADLINWLNSKNMCIDLVNVNVGGSGFI